MSQFQIPQEAIAQLEKIVGQSFLFLDQETRNHYGHDETEDYVFHQVLW